MKRIGILTFYDTTNYGALYQVYALYNVLKDLKFGCDISIIKYHCKKVDDREKNTISSIKDLKSFIRFMILYKRNKKKYKLFSDFSSKEFIYSKNEYFDHNIKKLSDEYDAVVVGSDQVWNTALTGNDFAFFLEGVDNVKKFSYAASIGKSKIENEELIRIKSNLDRFDRISVREKDAWELLNANKMSVSLVLDPTFLFDSTNWRSLKNTDIVIKKKYIMMYLIQDRKNTFAYAKKIAKKYNYEIIYINNSPRTEFGVKNIYYASPEDFLAYLDAAEIVITGSYHGLALAINLNKKFICELGKEKNNFNSRIQTLLDYFGLEDRLINYADENIEDIDYTHVNRIIDELRSNSYEYIKVMIDDIYK